MLISGRFTALYKKGFFILKRMNFALTTFSLNPISTLSLAFSSFVRDPKTGWFSSNQQTKSTYTQSDKAKMNFKRIKKLIPLFLLLLILVAVVLVTGKTIVSSMKAKDDRVTIKPARATQSINKELSFPIKDDKGTEITKLKYVIESAELRDEILVQGQRALAVKGKGFLILNIKITNSYTKPIDMNVRDYVRLVINGNDKEMIAADIHNDPVTIQALSTKTSRLGFPISDSDKKLILQVGELNGEKKSINLTVQ